MKRKVNRVGQNTLTVSLPAPWVKKIGLKQGDILNLHDDDGDIYISPSERSHDKKKETDIMLEKDDRIIIRSTLGALYRKGYDVVRIKYQPESIFKHIQESVNNLIGYEIMDHKVGFCVIKSMIIENEDELHSTMQKLINIVKSQQSTIRFEQQTIKKDYSHENYSSMDEIKNYRFTGWKLRDYSMRLLIKLNQFDEISYAYSTIIWTLEKIINIYKKVYSQLYELKPKHNEKLEKYLKEIESYFELFTKSINAKDLSRIEPLRRKKNALIKEGKELLKGNIDGYVLSLLLEVVKRIQDMSSSVIIIKS